MRAFVAVLLVCVAAQAAPRRPTSPRAVTPNSGQRPNVVFRLSPSEECAGTLGGSFGETVTTTRATNANCMRSDGVHVALTSNQSHTGAGGFVGEAAATNLALYSRDLSQAGTWVLTNVGCAKTATGTDAASNAASVCTTTGASATIVQTVTAGAANRIWSLYLKRRTGTGTVTVNTFDVTSLLSTSNWVRVSNVDSANLRATGANPVLTIAIATSGDAIEVDRVQLEAEGALKVVTQQSPSSPVDTTSGTATRNAAVVIGPAISGFGTKFSMAVTLYMYNPGASWQQTLQPYNSSGGTRLVMRVNNSTRKVECADNVNGTINNIISTGTISERTWYRIRCAYDGTNFQVCINDTCETEADSCSVQASYTSVNIGNNTGIVQNTFEGIMRDGCIGTTYEACR